LERFLTKNIKFTQKKYTDSNIFNKNKLVGWEKIQRLKIKPIELEQKKTDEYFELDEDFEIGKSISSIKVSLTKIISYKNELTMSYYAYTMLECTNPDLISTGSTFVKESLYSLLVKIENGKISFLNK